MKQNHTKPLLGTNVPHSFIPSSTTGTYQKESKLNVKFKILGVGIDIIIAIIDFIALCMIIYYVIQKVSQKNTENEPDNDKQLTSTRFKIFGFSIIVLKLIFTVLSLRKKIKSATNWNNLFTSLIAIIGISIEIFF